MKHFKLTFIVLGLLLFGCSQTNSKNTATTNKKSVDTTDEQIKQEKFDNLDDYKIDSVKNVIVLFKEKNIDKISNKISFPLYREYPIPPIKDKEEFRQRFSEVFDKILIDKIANSKIEQWSEVGWRGIMLDNGVLWMANSDGIITAVNYQSDFEKKLRKELIVKDRENLQVSLKTFENLTYKIKTKKYLIRIDELINGKYRYASWKIGEKESSKPDIIIENGDWEFEGSGGNHVITFVNGNYTYKVYRNIIGEDNSPDITLDIEKDGQTVLTEDGTLIIE
jgi:hypothetical protein